MISLYHFALSRGGLAHDEFLRRIVQPHLCVQLPAGVLLNPDGGGATVRIDPDDDAPELLTSRLVIELGPSGPAALTIGRASTNTYAIPDPRISKRHARLVRTRDGWFVTDHDSTNGTRVNGVALEPNQPCPLTDGDRISLAGAAEIQFLRPAGLYTVVRDAHRLLGGSR